MTERRPAEVFHPGEFLQDELTAREWSQVEFAEIIDRPVRLVNEIIKGKRGITPETAKALGAALGTSPEMWMNLETAYQLWKTEEASPSVALKAQMRTKYPIRDMALRSWIQMSENIEVLENQLLRYFEVKSLEETPRLAFTVATKRSGSDKEELNPLQLAWLYRVKHIADAMKTTDFSEKNVRNILPRLIELKLDAEGLKQIPQLMEECGIRFVIVEPLPSSKIDGVCLWIDQSPVIGMSLRYDRIDNFWFVLRHEIEHILNGDGRDSAILDSAVMETQEDENLSPRELAANVAAAQFCVPTEELDDFIERVDPFFSRKEVLRFAKRLEIHPGLIVGQLQWRIKRFDLLRSMLVSIRDIITRVAITDGYGQVLPVQM